MSCDYGYAMRIVCEILFYCGRFARLVFVCNGWGISLVGGEECEVGGDVVLSGS